MILERCSMYYNKVGWEKLFRQNYILIGIKKNSVASCTKRRHCLVPVFGTTLVRILQTRLYNFLVCHRDCMPTLQKCAPCLRSVSYTHLDVYKRQVMTLPYLFKIRCDIMRHAFIIKFLHPCLFFQKEAMVLGSKIKQAPTTGWTACNIGLKI